MIYRARTVKMPANAKPLVADLSAHPNGVPAVIETCASSKSSTEHPTIERARWQSNLLASTSRTTAPDRALRWFRLGKKRRNFGENGPEYQKDTSASRTFQSGEGEVMRRMSRC
jgi:hypothetical protein